VLATVAVGAASAALVVDHFSACGFGPMWLVTVLGLIVLAGRIWPVVLYQDGASQAHHLDEGFFVVLALVLPPDGVVLAFVGAGLAAQLIHRRPVAKSLFNLGQMVMSACAGIGVVHLFVASPEAHLTAAALAAAVLGAVVYFWVNSAAVAAIVATTGAATFWQGVFDALEIRALLLAASVSLGLVSALAISAYSWASVLTALPFWAFRQAMAGHFRARHDRSRLLGLFDAALDIHRTMGKDDVTAALEQAASSLLRSPSAAVVDAAPDSGAMAAPLVARGAEQWLVVSGRSRTEPFDDADRALLEALTAVGSGALENSYLYEERRGEQQRLVAITSSLGEGVCAFDTAGRITFLNPAAEGLLGWREAELTGSPDQAPPGITFLETPAMLAMRSEETVRSERATFVRRNGERFPVEYTCSAIRTGAEIGGAVLAFRDVSERVAFEEQLAFYAFHDALTSLPNRRVFLDRLQHALARSVRSGEVHAVLFADVDRFKVANDSLGHQAGDQVLIAIAERLRPLVRDGDTLARFGGDEFTLLLEDVEDAAAAEAVAMRMIELVRAPVILDGGRSVTTSISVGVALASAGSSPDDVLHDADVAMYEAKHRGADRHELFDALAMGARSADWLDLEVALRHAIDRGELVVHYQPMFGTKSRELLGAEALVRWDHPERGLLPPAHFIALAEATGLILPLGRFVLETACAQAQEWGQDRKGAFDIAVNLSARQFESRDLVEEVRDALRASGLDPAHLCLEITETLALEDIDKSIATLTELKQLGVRLAIDDFGTGYSSLNYLKRLPVDVVKLDRTFVQDLDLNPVDTAIVVAVVELARTIGMTAVAEGVETVEQLARLEAMGCPVVQGFLLARPMGAADLSQLLGTGVQRPADVPELR
jgi:diguanylate cyclase (GGDEF)-like protein/PAS domain S-box-containing protein